MLSRRVIACLDVKDGFVVKGTRFRNHEIMGDALDLARRYRDAGADELVFYDIAASAEGRTVDSDWIAQVSTLLDIPFCVAGGIRSVGDAERILAAGADKVSINSPALENPKLITDLARHFGTQCVVLGVDSRKSAAGRYEAYRYTGIEEKTQNAGLSTLEWVRRAQDLGAGEVVLNCMDSDGTGGGFDLEHLAEVRKCVSIPLIASGGARTPEHFERAYREGGADGALAAGAFHRGELKIPELKAELKRRGIEVRI